MTTIENQDRKRDLHRSSATHFCLHWVARGQCNVTACHEDRNRHRWMDHVTGWLRDGKPLLICEPYQITANDLDDIGQAARRFGLSVAIHGNGSYGFGTICIELTSATQREQETRDRAQRAYDQATQYARRVSMVRADTVKPDGVKH